jgi:purine-binding chemotaxis protein CheW
MSEELQVACFYIGEEEYAIDIMKIKEIIRPLKITFIPNSPPFIEGAINLRGMVIPVIDMRKRFNIPPENNIKKIKFIITVIENRIIGLIVDDVSRIIKIRLEDLLPPPSIFKGVDSKFIYGLYRDEDNLLVLLDLDNILTTSEKDMLEEI